MAAFPRPGKVLRAVLVAIAALGIANALLVNWIPGGEVVFRALAFDPAAIVSGSWWRIYTLFTSPLLTDPTAGGMWHLFFTLIGLYFLSTDLEKRWGSWRFARFLVTSVVMGTLLVWAFDVLTPREAQFFHVNGMLFGATAAITATAIAWGRENPDLQIRFFFFLPMSGKWLLWITIGFCFLQLLYKSPIPEGRMAPFGGVIAGLLLAGSPSLVRRAYLQARLWGLRRSGAPLFIKNGVEIEVLPRAKKRGGGPPLRVVIGGLEDEKQTPPKDKRYLN